MSILDQFSLGRRGLSARLAAMRSERFPDSPEESARCASRLNSGGTLFCLLLLSLTGAAPAQRDVKFDDLAPSARLAFSLLVIGGPVVSIALLWVTGVFDRRSIRRGPQRLGADESAWRLVLIGIVALGIMITSLATFD